MTDLEQKIVFQGLGPHEHKETSVQVQAGIVCLSFDESKIISVNEHRGPVAYLFESRSRLSYCPGPLIRKLDAQRINYREIQLIRGEEVSQTEQNLHKGVIYCLVSKDGDSKPQGIAVFMPKEERTEERRCDVTIAGSSDGMIVTGIPRLYYGQWDHHLKQIKETMETFEKEVKTGLSPDLEEQVQFDAVLEFLKKAREYSHRFDVHQKLSRTTSQRLGA